MSCCSMKGGAASTATFHSEAAIAAAAALRQNLSFRNLVLRELDLVLFCSGLVLEVMSELLAKNSFPQSFRW